MKNYLVFTSDFLVLGAGEAQAVVLKGWFEEEEKERFSKNACKSNGKTLIASNISLTIFSGNRREQKGEPLKFDNP